MTVLLAFFCLASCSQDAIDDIGMGILPPDDRIEVKSDSFRVTGTTVGMDNIYAKSIFGLLGKLSDPTYGTVAAGYACQFYPTAGFDGIVAGGGVDSVQLKILYTTYTGDSIAPMEVRVYPVHSPLTANYYTHNFDPSSFCNMSTAWGVQTYTARDMTISDSLYAATASGYYRVVSVNLPKEEFDDFLVEYNQDGHGAYASPEAMAVLFPGVYVTSTFGTGSMLNVEKTEIYMYYQRNYTTKAADGETDSAYVATSASVLSVTKEVIQLNHYTTSNGTTDLLASDAEKMYIKTPAGVCAQLTIDIEAIKAKMGTRKLSIVSLAIEALPKEYSPNFSFGFPAMGTVNTLNTTRAKLVLLEKDSVPTFFEESKTADNSSYYFATFNSTAYAYQYSNIANVVQKAIDKGLSTLELLLIPVQVSYVIESSYYSTSYTDYATANYLAPSAVTLKKDNINIRVVASDVK
ncbi:hypothetical protein AGMMS49982_09710 [Bacteroidia bacterium]|nr:hypothetical protein AGMMS49982_09710 [Bacteroidia bacterium]